MAVMDLTRYFSTKRKEGSLHHHHSSHSKDGGRKYLPLLANPINDDVREVLSGSFADIETSHSASKSHSGSSNTSTFAGNGKTSRGNVIIYKQHHEASTIELFYDLFFVANLGMKAGCIHKMLTNKTQRTLLISINTLMQSVRRSYTHHYWNKR
jgi:hypothetical protein